MASLTFLDATQSLKNASGINISSALEGQTVIYEIDLSNFEDGEIATNAVMSLTLPAEIQFTNWITQAGATIIGNTITWQASTMAKGDIKTISFKAEVVGD